MISIDSIVLSLHFVNVSYPINKYFIVNTDILDMRKHRVIKKNIYLNF